MDKTLIRSLKEIEAQKSVYLPCLICKLISYKCIPFYMHPCLYAPVDAKGMVYEAVDSNALKQ